MIIANTDALKTWLTSTLSRICNADPFALTKYVLALIKKARPENELRDLLLDQLEVFLLKETKPFVNLLFETLKSQSYIPNSANVSSTDGTCVSSPAKTVSSDFDSVNATAAKNKSKTEFDSRVKEECNSDGGGRPRSLGSEYTHQNDKNSHRSRSKTKPQFYTSPSKKSKARRHSRSDQLSHSQEKKVNKSMSPRSKSSDSNSTSHTHSRSRSREHEKSDLTDPPLAKTFDTQIVDHTHGDSDYRLKKPVSQIAHKYLKRCQDYDERGYCLKGSLCSFDHGTDPILVEDVSVLNFGVVPQDLMPFEDTATRSKSPMPPLPPTSPPLPPPPPPLPPLPPPSILDAALGTYIPEPYNPEAPGMNMTQGNYWGPPMCLPTPMPSSVPGILPSMYTLNKDHERETFHNVNIKPQRQRELIGVPTVNSLSCEKDNKLASAENKNFGKSYSSSGNQMMKDNDSFELKKRKGAFDFSRLGPPKKFAKCEKCVLELRKVPKHLNTIAMLNSHFSKFGRIVNLEVCYDNDPEAALVKFGSPMEATNAYRSSVAICNNRFIKVFYHREDGKNMQDPFSKPALQENTNPLTEIKIEKGQENSTGELKNSILTDKVPEKTFTTSTKYASIYTKKGNLSRTVFIPSPALKKSYSSSLHSQNQSREEKKEKNYPLEKQLELLRKKQEFLKCQIKCQKVILDKLTKCKNRKEVEFLKQTIETISSKIVDLKVEVKKESEDLKNRLQNKTALGIVNKSEAEKQLLDAEMDLYRASHKETAATKGDETAKLLSKVDELKRKARALGLIDGSPIGSATSRHLKLRKFSIHNVHPPSIPLPRKILVSGTEKIPIKDDERLLKHFQQFGNVERIEDLPSEDQTPLKVVTFSTRPEAEAAFIKGSKYDDVTLTLTWFQDPQLPNVKNPDHSNDSSEPKPPNPGIAVGDDEEEEEDEEDSEARSWRR